MLNRCMNCMQKLKDGHYFCPACGYNNQDYNNPERALPPGTVLNNKYQIGVVIGEGGFGITYVAWDMLIGIKIAIKEYFPSELVTRDTTLHNDRSAMNLTILQGNDTDNRYRKGLSRFVQEAENLAKFQKYPGIVSVKDFFYENNTAYMVMEYIDGVTLTTYLQNHGNKISVAETLCMLEPMMVTLDQIHQAGIIHRDISPENIMITVTGQVKLIDFGASRFVGTDGDKSLTVILKHGYAPEEQYRSNGMQGSWTDVYALCAVMYRMLTGEIPEETIQRMMGGTNTVHQALIQVANLPKQTRMAIEKGLAIKAEKRFQTIGILHDKIYHPAKKNIIPWILSSVIAIMIIFVCAEVAFLHNNIMLKSNSSEQTQAENAKDEQPPEKISRTETEPLQSKEINFSEPEILEEPEHMLALRKYYNENCVGEIGRFYFTDLTGDGQDEMIVVKDVQTLDPDDPYEGTVSTPNLTVYQYKNDTVNAIYSYQKELYTGWRTAEEPKVDLYLFVEENAAHILTYYLYSDFSTYIEETSMIDSGQNSAFNTELSQDELKQQIRQSILLMASSNYQGEQSWNELEALENCQTVLKYKEELEEVIQIIHIAEEPVLDYTHVYDEDRKCIFAVTSDAESNSSYTYNLSIWASHDSKIEEMANIPLGTADTPAMDWDKCELYQFGKSQHYFVELSGPGWWAQHKFCFENGTAREVKGNIYFLKNPDGRIQAQYYPSLEFSGNGENAAFSYYDYVDIFYYDQQYVEYGTTLTETTVLNQYENYEELLQSIDEEINKIEYIPDSLFSASYFNIHEAKLDHIRKSDNNIYYLNYKVNGIVYSSDPSDGQEYDGWIHFTVGPAGNHLELKKDINGEILFYGPAHECSDLGLPIYINGEIVN